MVRFVLRRLAIIPPALLLVNFFGFAFAHLVGPTHYERNPFLAGRIEHDPLLPAYLDYLDGVRRLDFGSMPGGQGPVSQAMANAAVASLGLIAIALALSAMLGLAVGLRGVRAEPPGIAPWLTTLATLGLAMPGFYMGSLLVMAILAYLIWGPGGDPPLPIQGFGWDSHLVLPVLVLTVRPTALAAQMASGLLVGELSKQYVVAARSFGHPWRRIRWHHALRNILAPMVVTAANSVRLLVGELIVVEWLFRWPGLGRLLALTLIPAQTSRDPGGQLFLNPPLLAAVLTALAALFLLSDLVAAAVIRALDPRSRDPQEEIPNV